MAEWPTSAAKTGESIPMQQAGKGCLVLALFIVTLWLGGCAVSQPPTSPPSSGGTVPRVDASALLAPRPTVMPATPATVASRPAHRQLAGVAPALLPVVAHSSTRVAEPAVYEPAAAAPSRRQTPRSRATNRASTRSSNRTARTPSAPPTPANEPAPPVPETTTDPVNNGHYHWDGDPGGGGNVKVVVNLSEQQAYVYRGDSLIGQSSVSTGRSGHRTPTGSFEILQKKRRHNSNLYNDAPMPYMQRLTWDGIALHGGELPGYPASHGCIRLPMGFAKKLFETTEHGTQVVVTQG